MRKVSLGELLGKSGALMAEGRTLSLDDLKELCGDAVPEIPFNGVGRHRLLNVLKGRFGRSYRNIPGIRDILKDHEEKTRLEERVRNLGAIKYKSTKKD